MKNGDIVNKMRLTGLIWTCEKCGKEFEVFSDDGVYDNTVCWNYCPHCGAKNNMWLRFKYPNEIILSGIGYEEAIKLKNKNKI